MKVKSVQIRREIREREVERYKAGVRETLMEMQRREFEEGERVMAVKRCLEQGDLSGYFNEFVASQQHLFYILPSELLIPSYCLFVEHLATFKGACLLQQAVSLHFELIFTHNLQASTHNRTFNTLITLINLYVARMGNKELDLPSAISCGLDCYLGIIKLFFLRKHAKHFAYDFSQIIREKVVRWSEELIGNRNYLQLVVNVVNNEQIAHVLKEVLSDLPKKDVFFKSLVSNIIETKGQVGTISINVLSSSIQCMKGAAFMPYFLEDWLQVLDLVYRDQSNHYKHVHLIQCLNILHTILHQLLKNEQFLRIKQSFQSHHTFSLLIMLLSSENEQRRILLLNILNLSLQIMLRGDEDITVLSERQILACLARELEGNNVLLQLGALKIIAALVRVETRRDLLYVLQDLRVPLMLEELQFHRNRQIAQLAEELLAREFYPQEYDCDIFYTDPSDAYDDEFE